MTVLIARGGRIGRWYIDVDEYTDEIPVFHHTLIAPDGQPYPPDFQFLNGFVYDQPCFHGTQRKLNQINRAKQLKGFVEGYPDFCLVCLSATIGPSRPERQAPAGRSYASGTRPLATWACSSSATPRWTAIGISASSSRSSFANSSSRAKRES